MTAQALTTTRVRSFVPFTQCAWCSRISLLGRYVRLPRIGRLTKQLEIAIPFVGRADVGLSHGICPSCYRTICGQSKKDGDSAVEFTESAL